MQVRFWGTRGSIAKAGESTVRYGGNTSCVELRSRAGTLIVLDCGTGAHGLGQALMAERPGPLKGHILITHTHWDHIQGIPFFAPLFAKGGEWDVYAPRGVGSSIRDALAGQMQYAYFPVALEDLGATIRFHDLVEGDFEVGDVRVGARYLNHPAVALGYRLESGGVSLAYVTDHEPHSRQLVGGAREFHGEDGRHAEFVAGVDLLIHDAQYTADEYPNRIGWGHSTFEYVVDLARLAGVRRLALFHHDPTRDDAALDRIVAAARERVAGSALEVVAAAEGQLLQLEPTVTEPASARSASAFAARDTSAALLDHSVLVAVADPRASSIIHGAVQADGLQLLTARDTDEVLELARRERPSLLLLDHDLSGRSAFELCRALRAGDAPWARDVSIVLVTDTEDPELVRAGAEAGVSDWLFTPFSSAYARTRIRCWVLRTACRWQRAPLPPGEAERLRVLHDLGILDTDPEERLDRLTRLAAAALDVPIALISLVDTDRQWFKSAHGLDARQTPRDRAFCAHAILGDDALVVADANADPRFADNPLVTAEPRVRFYAGFPLRLDGHAIGTLCVIDHRPRHLSEVQLQLLRDLAEVVRGELTLSPAAARRR